MNALQSTGVGLSLDDFGTGYSSLQYLKKLPLDQIKIDQSFVHDLATDASDKMIVRTIIIMAKSLGLEIIAEGVETDEQQRFLLDNGCTHYQGYFFGEPLKIEEFESVLKQFDFC
jgi:EAL domain-containing protein (putative c-di-GMP-specific phosphodiesterase class I)